MNQPPSSPVKMTGLVPYIFVADIDAAVDFYVSRLGFELHYRQDDDDDDLAVIYRNDVEFHICSCNCPDRRHVGNSYFEVRVEDAPALHAEFQAAGVPILCELERQPSGQIEFTIVDPEDNWVAFSSPCGNDR